MSLENLQLTLQRIQEIQSRFAPAAPAVDSGAGNPEAFSEALMGATDALNQQSMPEPGALSGLIEGQADRIGLDADLLKAVIRTESGFNPQAVSKAGARGLMQLMPGTAQALGVNNSFDPAQNIAGGAKYLKGLMNRYQDLPKALAAYNAGPGAVDRHGGVPPYAETTQYVKKVMQSYQNYQAQHQSMPATSMGGPQ